MNQNDCTKNFDRKHDFFEISREKLSTQPYVIIVCVYCGQLRRIDHKGSEVIDPSIT